MKDDARFDRIREVGGECYKAFLDAGYREHYSDTGIWLKNTPHLLQKRIRAEDGTTLFFVNAFAYDYSRYESAKDHPFGIDVEVQFNTHGDQSPTFNVSYFYRDDDTPATAEAIFRKMYDAMGCQPYGDD